MKHVMIWLIGLYRKFISPLKGRPTCRFTPTCSAYAMEAFKKRGFFIGFILSTWRVLRCNPFSKGGYDPVPEKGLRRVKDARPPEWTDLDFECEDTLADPTEEARLPEKTNELSPMSDSSLTESGDTSAIPNATEGGAKMRDANPIPTVAEATAEGEQTPAV